MDTILNKLEQLLENDCDVHLATYRYPDGSHTYSVYLEWNPYYSSRASKSLYGYNNLEATLQSALHWAAETIDPLIAARESLAEIAMKLSMEDIKRIKESALIRGWNPKVMGEDSDGEYPSKEALNGRR